MGTTLVKEAATKSGNTMEVQALQCDDLIELFARNLIANIQEKFPDHSNIQKNDLEPGFETKAAQKADNDDFFAGFANSEHVVKLLQDCSHEKYFKVFTDEYTTNYTKIQQVRILLLYTIFMQKTEGTFTQEDFFEYFEKFLKSENSDSASTRKNVGLNTGLRFALSLLQEIHLISPSLLENSLQNLYQALCDAPAGSLYGIDIFAFQQDATLNEARDFLASLVTQRQSHANSLTELCMKTIVRLGVARSNAEDLLVAVKLINGDGDLAKIIDLRDEINYLTRATNVIPQLGKPSESIEPEIKRQILTKVMLVNTFDGLFDQQIEFVNQEVLSMGYPLLDMGIGITTQAEGDLAVGYVTYDIANQDPTQGKRIHKVVNKNYHSEQSWDQSFTWVMLQVQQSGGKFFRHSVCPIQYKANNQVSIVWFWDQTPTTKFNNHQIKRFSKPEWQDVINDAQTWSRTGLTGRKPIDVKVSSAHNNGDAIISIIHVADPKGESYNLDFGFDTMPGTHQSIMNIVSEKVQKVQANQFISTSICPRKTLVNDVKVTMCVKIQPKAPQKTVVSQQKKCLLQENRGKIKSDTRYSCPMEYSKYFNDFATDGKTMFYNYEGFFTTSCPRDPSDTIFTETNTMKSMPEWKSSNCMMYLNDKLYMRLPNNPFTVFDPESLQLNIKETETITRTLVSQESQNDLQWLSDFDPSSNNRFMCGPYFTDGKTVYCMSMKNEKGRDYPDLFIESFCPTDWQHLNSVQLLSSNGQPFWQKKYSLEDFLTKINLVSNGTYIMLSQENKRHLFDLQSGIRIEKQKADHFNGSVLHDYINNRFLMFINESDHQYCIDFTIDSLKIENKPNKTPQTFEDDKSLIQKFKEQYLTGHVDLPISNIRQRLIHGIQKKVPATQIALPENSGSLVRAILLNFIAQNCEELDAEFTKLDPKINPTEKYLMFFHWPGATYLTESLFDSLRDLLISLKTLIKSKKSADNLADQQSLLCTIKILGANMKALNFCGIKLSEIFYDAAKMEFFVDAFKESILYLTEQGLPVDEESDMRACGFLWDQIIEECKNVMANSVSMLYADASDVIQQLSATLSQQNLSEKMQDSCAFSLLFLSNPGNLKNLVQLDSSQSMESIITIVSALEKLQTSSTISRIQGQKPFKQLTKLDPISTLIQACDQFERSFYEYILIQLERQNIELAKKADKTQAGKGKRAQIETNVKKLLTLVPLIFSNLCNRVSSSFITILDLINQSVSQHEEGLAEEVAKAFGSYCTRIHTLLTSPSKIHLLLLYVTSLSQICIDQPQIINLVTNGSVKLIESATKLANFLEEQKYVVLGEKENNFVSALKSLVRKTSWLVGSLSFNLIRVKKMQQTTDPKEKMIRMLMESKVLSGGIENRFLPTFDTAAKEKLIHTLEFSNDQNSQDILKKDIICLSDEDELLQKILRHSEDEGVERLIDCLQICIEHPQAMQPHSKLHGAAGMTVSRAAFAVMIKYAQLTDSVEEVIQTVEDAFENQDQILSRQEKLKEVRLQVKNDLTFQKLLQEWIKASKMRKWITEKKMNLSIKIESTIRDKYYKRKAAFAQTQPSGETQINTQDQNEVQNSEISALVDIQLEKDLNEIFQKVIAKAEFLLQLQVPASYEILGSSKLSKLKSLREQDEIALQMENEGWKDRLKRLKSMKKQEQQLVQDQRLYKQVFENENNSIMAVLEAAVSVEVIKKFVQEDFIKATLRIQGLQLVYKVIQLPIQDEIVNDLTNWFKVSLRENTNKLAHYVSNIKCRGNYTEEQLRKYFFLILKCILEKIKASKSSQQIIRLLDALRWKFLGKDHSALVDLNIFQCLREGDGSKDHPIKKVWGKKIDKNQQEEDTEPTCLQKELMETFEFLLFNISSRIIDSELGSLIQLKKQGTGTQLPGIERRKSLITSSVSESLIGQVFSTIFKELCRYIDIFKQFKGFDYQAFAIASNKHTTANSDKVLGEEFETDLLFDMEEEEDEDCEDSVTFGEDSEQNQLEYINAKLEAFEQKQVKAIHKVYDGAYLRRLLRMVDIFISAAQTKNSAQSVVKSLADNKMIMVLFDLFGHVEPRNQILILKIVQNLISVGISTSIFDATMILLKATNQSAFRAESKIKFESQFITFWTGHFYNIRSAMFNESTIANQGAYEVSQEIGRLINRIQLQQESQYDSWRAQIKEVLTDAYLHIETLSNVDRDLVFALEPGADFNRISIGSTAVTDNNQLVTVLGFQSKPKDENDRTTIKMDTTFTDLNQMAFCLYFNQNHKEKQEIIQVAPHSLTPIHSLDLDISKTLAQNSVLINPQVLKHLVHLLSDKSQPSDMKVQILKAFSQLSKYSADFMDILKQNGLLQTIIAELFNITFNTRTDSKDPHVPVSWLEAKVTNMRAHAIENFSSLKISTNMKCHVVNKQSLLFSSVELETGRKLGKSALILASFNIQRVSDKAQYQVQTTSNDLTCKGNVRLVDCEQMMKVDKQLLQLMKTTEAVITHDVKLKDFLKEITNKVKTEKQSGDWSSVFQCVIYVIEKTNFDSIKKQLDGSSFFSELSANLPVKTSNSFQDFKKMYEEWANINIDILMDEMYELEDKSADSVRKALPVMIEKVKNKVQEDVEVTLLKLTQEGDETKLNEFIDAQNKKKLRQPFEFQNKDLVKATVEELLRQASKKIETECDIYNVLDGDETYLSQVICNNFVVSKEREEGSKKNVNPAQSYLTTITAFDTKQLAKSYEATFLKLLHEYSGNTIWAMLNCEDIEKIIPIFMQDHNQSVLLANFLKSRFHRAQQEMINTGLKTELKAVKSLIRKIIDFCLNKDQSCKQFVHMFLHDNIIKAGGVTLTKIQKSTKQEGITAHFESEQDSIEGLHPDLLIFIIKVSLELRLSYLLESRSYLPALMGLAMGMFSWYWRPTETELPQKLLRQCQNMIFFTQEYLQIFVETGVAHKMINCPIITHIVKQIDFSQAQNLSTVQKLLLEVYLSLISLKEMVEQKLGQKINTILYLNQELIDIKRSLKIVKEKLNSDFLKYFLHSKTLSDAQREKLDQKLATMHPHLDVVIKAKLSFEEIKSLDLIQNSQTQLKGMSWIGISDNSEGKEMKLYNQKDLTETNIKHGSGELYLFYPISKQSLVAFGDNRRNRMGEMGDENFPTVCPETLNKIRSPVIQVKCNRFSSFIMTESRELYATGGCYNYPGRTEKFTKVDLPGEIPERIFEGRRSRFVITKSGKTFFCGQIKTSVEWPNQMQPTPEMKEFKLSNDANFEQKIIHVSCGSFYNIFLTNKGQIWAIGERILERMNNSNRETPQKVTLPDGHFANGIWAGYEKRNPLIIANLKNNTTGETGLWSIGYSDKGQLGQGDGRDSSNSFVKLDYDHSAIQFVKVAVHENSALAIDQNGDLWSWGRNWDGSIGQQTNGPEYFWKPTKVQAFQDLGLKGIKVSMGRRHGLILAQEANGQVSLWSMGKNTSYPNCFGVTQDELSRSLIRKIPGLAGSVIQDFFASAHFSMVIVKGSDLTKTLYLHELPENKKAQGVLHAYQRDGKWHYMTKEEYESTNGANLPDICLAFKCPIPNLDTVMNGQSPLIQDDLNNLLSDQKSDSKVISSHSLNPIEGIVYSSKAQINGESVNVNLSEFEMLKQTTKFDVNPLIYFRLAKPLKEGKVLPLLDLTKIYKTTDQFGFEIIVKADFSYDVNSKMLEMTQKEFQSLDNSLKNFPVEADHELYEQMDRQVSEHDNDLKIDHYSKYRVQDMTWDKFSKINSADKLSIENRMKLIWCYNYFFVQLEGFLTPVGVNHGFKGQKIECQSAALVSYNAKHLALSSVKMSFVRRAIQRLVTGEECREVQVSRDEAMRFIESGQVDNTGEFTLFGQIFKQLNGNYDCWKHNNVDARALRVRFLNEASIDAGGPFRETLTNFVTEMESGALPHLVMTENHKNNYGDNRDSFILNSDSTMPTHQSMFRFLGVLIGFAFRTGSCIPFNFAPIVWKQIVGEEPKEIDLKAQDTFTWQNFNDLRKNAKDIQSQEEFEEIVDQYFTYTQNGREIELCKDGSTRKVNQSNLEEFIQLTCNKIFQQGLQQAKWIQDGMQMIISREIVNMLSWRDVEQRVCGTKSTDVEKLKQITEYEYCSEESPVIKYFWSVMRRMSEANKSAYLKFVWGRQRLPTDLSNLSRRHKIKVIDSWASTRLPESHTCFFALDIPNYTSEEQLEQKLMISIEFCGEIDNDR